MNTKGRGNAIEVNELKIGYGSVRVIEGLDMKVPTGSIYSLLGPSGCGKSTLLKVILGSLSPEQGEVLVFGRAPGSVGHKVPGSAVGYAPQEAALYTDITMEETFQFHAKLQGMSREMLESRKKWLSEFLDLPPMNRVVGELSGGQSRRLSLAVALLHDPQLLILDEPTVGVDPLLRSRIWQHLVEVARSGVTVIVTTHYIEEARQAHCVGLMRNGRLLEEGPPRELIQKYSLSTLEEVFLVLCKGEEESFVKQKEPSESTPLLVNNASYASHDNSGDIPLPSGNSSTSILTPSNYVHTSISSLDSSPPSFVDSFFSTISHTLAIAQRKSKQMIRNRKLLAYTLLTPAFQIFLFFIAIGPNPRNLNFAVVNSDIGIENFNLGNLVVQNLASDSHIFNLHYYTNLECAVDRVKIGKEWGVMYIPTNFTVAMTQKFSSQDPNTQNQSTLHLYLDMSNYQITILVQQEILSAFQDTISNEFKLNLNPVQVDEAVYGSTDVQFKNFLAPGMIALICFAHSIGITAVAFVREKNDGTMDRIHAAGVNAKAIIIGHYLISNAILVVQTAMLLVLVIFAFDVDIKGNIAWVIVILWALGGVGMSLGLVISGAANIETEAVQLSLSAYFPALLLSGVIWPLEAIPNWISWLSYSLPTTWAAQGLRSVMIRGWGITYPQVWQAILIIIAWSIVLMLIAILILKTHSIKVWCKKFK